MTIQKIKINSLLVILLWVSGIMINASCKKFDNANNNTKVNTQATPDALFLSATKNLSDIVTSTNQSYNPFRLWAQYWTETTYTNEVNYNIVNGGIADNWFSVLYVLTLQNYDAAKLQEKTLNPTGNPSQQNTRLAIIDIMQVYTYSMLVELFGDVPYTESNKVGTTLLPKYDLQTDIYDSLITRLYEDIAVLKANTATPNFGNNDVIYKGNASQWLKFANSMLLRLGMMLVDVPQGLIKYTATQLVTDAVAGGVFTANTDDALFPYLASTPNTNPLYVDIVTTNRQDFVANQTFIDTLNQNKDTSRVKIFFQPVNTNNGLRYIGGKNGANGITAISYSLPGTAMNNPVLPGVFLSFAEVQFLLAEATARGGLGVSGNAADYYYAGMKASLEYWIAHQSGTNEVADFATLQTNYPYPNTNLNDNIKAIALQLWIALYNQGFEGWTQWRRLDYPSLPVAAIPYHTAINKEGIAEIPKRFTYPINEQGTNGTNWNNAANSIGNGSFGDYMYTRLFWDRYNNQWGTTNQINPSLAAPVNP